MKTSTWKKLTIPAGVLVLVLLILYSGGFLTTGKIGPGGKTEPPPLPPLETKGEGHAELAQLNDYYEAVGTVRPRTESRVGAQLSARVLEVKVNAGQQVKRGQLLVVLDDRQVKAQKAQAQAGLAGARAAQDRARTEFKRIQTYLAGQAATEQDLEKAREMLLTAESRVRQAAQSVEEVDIALGYTQVKSPEDGQVVRRLVEPGDLVMPGQPLVQMQAGQSLRLEALVREGLVNRLHLQEAMAVSLPALNREVVGTVEEIVPLADPQTRTFLVKAALNDPPPGLYPGMFGRLLVPVGQSEVILAPVAALVHIGQLEVVYVKTPQGWQRVHVTTGRVRRGRVEILSGLAGGETVALMAEPHV
ncbi:MAG: efflux RND transporter periplasmic adaptor subunit [Deltaproteobacteria bacterium]|nr:efflux RND transporter periplasmic adaptor subunit [Deltaproteobacteria bacterium]